MNRPIISFKKIKKDYLVCILHAWEIVSQNETITPNNTLTQHAKIQTLNGDGTSIDCALQTL